MATPTPTNDPQERGQERAPQGDHPIQGQKPDPREEAGGIDRHQDRNPGSDQQPREQDLRKARRDEPE